VAFDKELKAALAAADRAAQVIRNHYQLRDAMTDAPASISTATDRESQETILRSLCEQFPEDAYRAEEKTPSLSGLRTGGSRMWIIDPIDGTRGFAKKNGQFSVMIARVVDGEVVVGVVHEPVLNRITFAQRGGGCWRRDGDGNPMQVHVSSDANCDRLTLTQSHTKIGRAPTAAVQNLKPVRVLETYSAGIKLAQVARGEADVYACEYVAMYDWDIAAGHILVTEAGGRVSMNDGRQLSFGGENPLQVGRLIATNGLLHDHVLTKLRTM
jgi:3'(2'), 5'-bisphosphate nucleotidase